jgi:hypothetical protein
MSQRWLKLLERIGAPTRTVPELSDVRHPPRLRQGLWHEFRDYDILFQLYGPPENSPFFPYHCPTIFAAIDRLKLQPRLTELSTEVTVERPDGVWAWLDRETFVLLELPGGLSVQMGAHLLIEAGAQLVSTFDHWPLANPVRPFDESSYTGMEAMPWPPQQIRINVAIDSRDILDSMVTLAPRVFEQTLKGIAADAPAVWMCDSRRTVATRPGPGDFDNRYFIDDSILPAEAQLRRLGIRKLVFFGASTQTSPSNDLSVFINECHRAGMELLSVALDDPATWALPLPMSPPPEVRLSGIKFPKSQIGGFGRQVPVPSESSGGSFSGAGG